MLGVKKKGWVKGRGMRDLRAERGMREGGETNDDDTKASLVLVGTMEACRRGAAVVNEERKKRVVCRLAAAARRAGWKFTLRVDRGKLAIAATAECGPTQSSLLPFRSSAQAESQGCCITVLEGQCEGERGPGCVRVIKRATACQRSETRPIPHLPKASPSLCLPSALSDRFDV